MNIQDFKPVTSMQVRTKYGSIMNQVKKEKQRFEVQRDGKPIALIVPLEDRGVIEQQTSKTKIQAAYAALDTIKGVVKDPNLKDASSTIDAWVYGDKEQGDNDE